MFVNRKEAGLQLASRLQHTPSIQRTAQSRLLVLSIPRGGVVVGQAVAQTLDCEHGVVIVKKIAFPGQEELAVGAIAEDGLMVLNRPLLAWNHLTGYDIEPQIERARVKVARYIQLFRQGSALDIGGKTIILVDDGAATGETLKAAVRWIRSKAGADAAQRLIIAVPVGSRSTIRSLAEQADEVICLLIPAHFEAVGQFYLHFEQVSDSEVLDILQHARQKAG